MIYTLKPFEKKMKAAQNLLQSGYGRYLVCFSHSYTGTMKIFLPKVSLNCKIKTYIGLELK